MDRELVRLLSEAKDHVVAAKVMVSGARRRDPAPWRSWDMIDDALQDAMKDLEGMIDSAAFKDVDEKGETWPSTG
jgi:hypothetical protein